MVERLDFALAERWLDALRPIAQPGDSALTRAELMLLISAALRRRGSDRRPARLRRGARGIGARVAAGRGMMAWCYWHAGRVDEAQLVIGEAEQGSDAAAIHYLFALVGRNGSGPAAMPELTGGPLDALIMRVNFAHGRLREMAEPPASPWAAAVAAPWRIALLRAMGRTEQALELYEAYDVTDGAPVWFHSIVEPDLMIDLGRLKQAQDAVAHGRTLLRESGSVVSELLNRVLEAKIELRLRHDHERAAAVLRELEARPETGVYEFVNEQIHTWTGMTLLFQGQEAAAARRLRRAVRSMRGRHLLELPTAAIFLAEASGSSGGGQQAYAAGDLALWAAGRQGSNHILLQALADASVAARRIEGLSRGPTRPGPSSAAR